MNTFFECVNVKTLRERRKAEEMGSELKETNGLIGHTNRNVSARKKRRPSELKMSLPAKVVRVIVRVAHGYLFNILYIPAFIYRLFLKPKVVSPVKNELLLIPASDLAEKIRKKEISCESVIRAYITRIQEVNPLLNAIVNERFDEALEEAKNVDKLLQTNTEEHFKEKYPLLGVPLTVKASLALRNLPHTSGSLHRRDVIADKDAEAVRKARLAGAIPLLTSNIPELCLNYETQNKLIGTTRNPYNTTRTVGGSSGGEAALMASGASIIGIGSDVGGSLRLPPHFCGTFGHKPTPGVVSYEGHFPSCKREKEWTAFFTVGPMARYAIDLKLLLGVIAKDEFKSNLQLESQVIVKKIKVHYLEDMENLLMNKVNNDTRTTIKKTIDYLDKVCENKCQRVKMPLMKYAVDLATLILLDIDDVDNLFTGKGDGSVLELLKYFSCRSDSELTSIFYGILKKIHSWIPGKSMVKVQENMNELKTEFLELLGDNGVLILPAFTQEAHYHGDGLRKILDGGYMSIFNALGFPVTCCPVSYSRNKLPIGIQIVAAPYCDRLTIAVSEELETAFGGWHSPGTLK